MRNSYCNSFPDPFSMVSRILSKLHSLWLAWTYPFASLGRSLWIHHSCQLPRSIAPHIRIGNSVHIYHDVWLNILSLRNNNEPQILLDDGCNIARRCIVSAQNCIHIGRDAIIGPAALITDHYHVFEGTNAPIAHQKATAGGTIRIEEGCWIGFGAAIVCSQGELVIGRNSVVGANSVVGRSIPPYSVVSGNPGRVVRQYDLSKEKWVIGSSAPTSRL